MVLPIVKHETKLVMNQTYADHKACEWEGFYAYTSIMGGFLCLHLNNGRVLTLISRHNFPPTLEE